MKKFIVAIAAAFAFASAAAPSRAQNNELTRWQQHSQSVTITRDDWGIAHVHGKTDADAVFGMVYAQAEDDFNRVETNFINSQGRLAEAEGESAIWRDLRMKLYIDPADMKARYAEQPGMAAEADERLGRRLQFLSRETSRRKAASDQTFRAMDGADL